ncbi:hypothetical protein H2200_008710 [Cladophialophora chaetospira]|uniref:Uncharacterized protein n=1 Tax=Cladophialophora chaetospira TaxID=386627 RepID=A0AA38X4J6_9EURO|nr:hypothetical protein H2200_008710 [Cladophialophora chaetospira]
MSCTLFPAQGQPNLISFEGNTDPFGTQPVTLNASTNLYLGIGLQYLENHVWSSGLQLWCVPRGYSTALVTKFDRGFRRKRRDEIFALEVFKDDSQLASIHINTGLAYSAWALFAVTGDRQHQISATNYTAQCLVGLRNYISEAKDRASFQPEHLIFRIIRADILGGHLASALIHAKFLKRLTLARIEAGNGDPVFFNHALYQTNNLALALWKRPMFDPTSVEQFYMKYWTLSMDYTPDMTDFQKRMKFFSQNFRLQKLLEDTAMLFYLTDSCLTGRLSIPSEKYCALNVRAEYLQICLINLVHDQQDRCRLITAPPLTATMNANICLALTAILSIRFQKHEPMINGVPASTVSLTVLGKLQTACIQLDSNMTPLEKEQFADASLWIAFIAALVEHRFSGVAAHLKSPEQWWWSRLTSLISRRKIRSWLQVHQCLIQFPYHNSETPLPRADWLDETFRSVGKI